MAIKRLEKVYCSLNLGYVYNVNYSFQPQAGVRITLFFVNERGVYNTNFLKSKNPQKAQIKIGDAVFNVYPVSRELSKSGSQKTLKVDFIDDTIKLKNYYVALTGKGCGDGVFQLGRVVDKRTDGEKEREDPDLFRIKQFTQDQDLEYSFGEFITVLKKVFPVQIRPNFDDSITRPFTGTFEEVLSAWCSYFNFSYFFENGKLIVFDPTSLNINFPSIPTDAIESSESESIENTYDKTVWYNFYKDGEPIQIGSENTDSNIFIANETLYPWENLGDIKILNDGIYGAIDLNQVAAAQYGKEVWFLYNYQKGTADQICGFSRYATNGSEFSITQEKRQEILSALSSGKDLAFFNKDLFEKNYSFYYNYGRNVAGKYYISRAKLGLGTFSLYQWHDQNGINSLTIEALKQNPSVKADFFINPVGTSYGLLKESLSGEFQGIALNGQRIFVKDEHQINFDSIFALTESQVQEINGFYKNFNGDFGSGFIQWGDGTSREYIIYGDESFPSSILTLINNLESKKSAFSYRYSNFQMKGYFNSKDLIDNKQNDLFDTTDIQITGGGPQVNSNTSIIKAKKDSEYVAYYSKYNTCNSKSTKSGLLNRRFESITPSIDIPVPITLSKNSRGVVTINRNLTFINQYNNSGILDRFAQSFDVPEKRLSFTLNYFYDGIPTSFISNGLVGLSISISENGLTASYSYSNEMLRVPPSTQLIEQLERNMKSSWVRTYIPPKQVKL